jgi:hypothetical protein
MQGCVFLLSLIVRHQVYMYMPHCLSPKLTCISSLCSASSRLATASRGTRCLLTTPSWSKSPSWAHRNPHACHHTCLADRPTPNPRIRACLRGPADDTRNAECRVCYDARCALFPSHYKSLRRALFLLKPLWRCPWGSQRTLAACLALPASRLTAASEGPPSRHASFPRSMTHHGPPPRGGPPRSRSPVSLELLCSVSQVGA